MKCECGGTYTKNFEGVHNSTKRHQEYIEGKTKGFLDDLGFLNKTKLNKTLELIKKMEKDLFGSKSSK